MKRIMYIIAAAALFTACTNAGEGTNTSDSLTVPSDSLTQPDNSDPNNRNTTTYDSAARSGDTASYERMRQMKTDSTGQH